MARSEPALPGQVNLPFEWSDLKVEVANPALAGAVFFGPPALLTIVWLWRRKQAGEASA
jgi:hypothetical protein